MCRKTSSSIVGANLEAQVVRSSFESLLSKIILYIRSSNFYVYVIDIKSRLSNRLEILARKKISFSEYIRNKENSDFTIDIVQLTNEAYIVK